jgi:hypothetical protein
MYSLSNTCTVNTLKKEAEEDLNQDQKKAKSRKVAANSKEALGSRFFAKDGVIAGEPPSYRKIKNGTMQSMIKEFLLRKSKDFSPGGTRYNGNLMDTQGLYAYDLKRLAKD